jgi:ABC-2 type transport system ATP-binding protein
VRDPLPDAVTRHLERVERLAEDVPTHAHEDIEYIGRVQVPSATGEVLAVRGLTKRFDDVTALDDVTFAIDGPRLVGILGPNGAGKTTLLDILEGLAEPEAGEVRLFGEPLRVYPRRRVGVVLQKEFTIDHVTVGEYAELFAAIYEVKGGREKILREAKLEGRAKVSVDRISGGEAQRLFIAAAQVHDPDLLFLDEPTAHMDPPSKAELGAWLREVAKKRTVVITTHDLAEADAICEYVVFLVRGKVRALGTRAELVDAVPAEKRAGIASAFFHFCSVRIEGGVEIE